MDEARRLSRRTFLKESTSVAASALAVAQTGRAQGGRSASSPARAIVVLGAPGSGKSEQARRLAEKLGVPSISTGDLLRDHVKRGTPLGLQADPYMKSGKLVPDTLMNPVLEERLSRPDCTRGFILDGYPRTLAQAEALDVMLKKRGLASHVLLLDVPSEALLKRLAGRRVCPNCQRTYNVYYKPPKKEGVCDECGAALVQRPDDREDVVRKRLETYQTQTQSATEYYERQGRLVRVNGDQSPEAVAAEIESKLAPS